MTEIVAKQPLLLNALKSDFHSFKVEIDPLTTLISLEIDRPTTVGAVIWDEKTTIAVDLSIDLDGVVYKCSGSASGGIRVKETIEQPVYRLFYTLPWGFFGGTRTKTLGETKISIFTLECNIALTSGTELISTVYVYTESNPLPLLESHQSVGFDAASSGQEDSGDGVVSVTHTAGGADRLAIVGVATDGNFTSASGTVTYGGSGATNITTLDGFFAQIAAYRYTAPPASAQTVTSDLDVTSPFTHIVGVCTFTGVDQTTPVGTPATQEGTSASSPATVTVGSVGSDDMVSDVFFLRTGATTIGADQTAQVSVTNGGHPDCFRMSTQPGSAGGVMSWTWTGTAHMALAGVGLKAVAAGGGASPNPPVLVKQAVHRGSFY